MSVFKKAGAVLGAALIVSALSASSALANGTISGSITVGSPPTTCTFTGTYTGNIPPPAPTSISVNPASVVVSGPSPCDTVRLNSLTINFAAGGGATAAGSIRVTLPIIGNCTYTASSLTGTWAAGAPVTATASGSATSSGFLCPTPQPVAASVSLT